MRTPKRRIVAGPLGLAALLLLAGACDPSATTKGDKAKDDKAKQGEAKQDEAKQDEAKQGEAEAPDTKTDPAKATLDACLAECESAEGMSEDNRATCRLQCKNAHEAPGGADTKHPAIGAYYGCFDECAGKSPDNRATCQKNCAASVTSGDEARAKGACPRGCLEALGSCLVPCEAKGEDDKATCRKQCQAVTSRCVEGCGAEAAPQ